METHQRKRRSILDWRKLLEEHAESGESVTAFCRRTNISETHLYRWRRRFRDGKKVTKNTGEITAETTPKNTPKTTTKTCAEKSKAIVPHSFIEVNLNEFNEQNELRENPQDSGVTITLKKSRQISLKIGFDCETLDRVVHALERTNA